MSYKFHRHSNFRFSKMPDPSHYNSEPMLISDMHDLINSVESIQRFIGYWKKGTNYFIKKITEPIEDADIKGMMFESKRFFGTSRYNDTCRGAFIVNPAVFEYMREEALHDDRVKKDLSVSKKLDFDEAYSYLSNRLFISKLGSGDIESIKHPAVSGYMSLIEFDQIDDKVATDANVKDMFECIVNTYQIAERIYYKCDIGGVMRRMLCDGIMYFGNKGDIKMVDSIIELAQGVYKEKSLAFLKQTKAYMSRKGAVSAKTNPAKPIKDVLDCANPFIMYYYMDYMRRTYCGGKKLPTVFTNEDARQKFMTAVMFATKKNLVSESMAASFRDMFDNYMTSRKNAPEKTYLSYYYLLGNAIGHVSKFSVCEYLSQNFDVFRKMLSEYSKTAPLADPRWRGSESFKPKYVEYEFIRDIGRTLENYNDRKPFIELFAKYINYGMPSDKELRILIDSFISGMLEHPIAGARSDLSKDNGINTFPEPAYSKQMFLADASPFLSEPSREKVLSYTLED